MKLPNSDERVFISLMYAGFRVMQVCVLPEVSDEEILAECNSKNPQLVSGGWHTVIHSVEHAKKVGVNACAAPGSCVECKGRIHKIVVCM